MPDTRTVLIGIPVLLTGGGTEVQVLGLVRALAGAGYEVTVCCYYEFDESVVALFEHAGARVICLGLTRSRAHFRIGAMVLLLRRLAKVIRELRPDIVHVQYLAPALLAILAAKFAGARRIFATSHIAGSYAYGRKAKALLRVAGGLCTVFFCVSQGVERFWFGDSQVFNPGNPQKGRKHFTIYNAIDVEHIRRLALLSSALRPSELVPPPRDPTIPIPYSSGSELRRPASGYPDSELLSSALRPSELVPPPRDPHKVIGIVGRMAEQKGHAVLLDAMKEVVREVPDAVLRIIGDGPLRSSLESQITNHGLLSHVQFLGMRPQEEVFRLYGSMDVFAMPSLFEGFGLTAAEAMAAELPVVATAIEGLSEVIDNGVTGYLVPPGDVHALALRLIELLKDADKRRRMGEAGYARVKEQVGMERYRELILAAYKHFAAIPSI